MISQRQLRNDNADVMRRVEQGESFVVTRHGHPVADLVPPAPRPHAPRFVRIDDLAESYAALAPIDRVSWYRDRDEQPAAIGDLTDDPWSRVAGPRE